MITHGEPDITLKDAIQDPIKFSFPFLMDDVYFKYDINSPTLNNAATIIQSNYRGYVSRVKALDAMDIQSTKESIYSLPSSRSTLFQTPSFEIPRQQESYPIKMKSEPVASRMEERPFIQLSQSDSFWNPKAEPKRSGSDPELASADYFRQIWSPITTTAPRAPVKSMSSSSLPGLQEVNYNDPQLLNNTLANFNTQSFNDTKEYKTTFKNLVEKIVKTNDQPCSIFLQQRLRVENHEVKSLIFDAIMGHVLSLMKNRFGNFLIQCCLECGTDDQIQALCSKMRGHVVQLSCDRFGCHVMQKAIEKLGQEVKLMLISELFQSIPETFTHRFACHVWQRVFEIKWNPGTPSIMDYIQSSVVGQWAAIANDENGSLVVQCIFEHCSQQEKLQVINEIFACTADIAKGQWGNWVIQHILEHGLSSEQNHIISVVLENVFEMSIDQYASKVVEKCVKIASKRDLQQFVEEIIKVESDRECPYILSMMNNQYGNYVVQNVLSVAESSQRESCVKLLAPHIPVLRASKYGQRVASLCEKYIRLAQHKFNPQAMINNTGYNVVL
ncbi:hypothetical protein HDV06_002932 [Boothiomyces sp. JEL0866]|nr:hypothetical protein HDV06_002932 [Boothiomyces sp. JEL0866]